MSSASTRLMHCLRLLMAAACLAAAAPAGAAHFPWDQGHDTTKPDTPQDPGPCDQPECDPCKTGATRSPVYAATGHAFWIETDAALRGLPPIVMQRSYSSNDPTMGLFGNGWTTDLDVGLFPVRSGGQVQRVLRVKTGKRLVFTQRPDGSYQAPASCFDTLTEAPGGATLVTQDKQQRLYANDGRLLEYRDAGGRRLLYKYDAQGRPIRIADDNGRFVAIAYNGLGLVETVTDHGGRNWRYAYDATGNLTRVTDPAGGVRRYRYQAYRPLGDSHTYQQLLSVTDASGVVEVQYTYTGNQVASYTQGSNRFTYVRTVGNNNQGGTVTRTDLMGHQTRFTYGPQGLVTQDIDGLSNVTSYVYDANGHRIQTTDALSRIWREGRDSLGRMTYSENPLGERATLSYAGSDPWPTQITSPAGKVFAMTYDAAGHLLTSTDPSGAVTRNTYSSLGDLTQTRNALGQRTSFQYTATGLPTRITDALDRQIKYSYDALGRLQTVTDMAGEKTQYTYDAMDRPTSVTDALGQVTTLTYDAAGRILTLTDAKGSRTEYRYDAYGRRSAEVAPDGRTTQFGYRLDNLLDRTTWPDSTVISYLYDANKRRTRETAGSEIINYAYTAVNHLQSASGPGGTVSYTYDEAGRTRTETSGGYTHSSTYNADGERTQLDYLTLSQTFTRDARGLITRIAAPAGNFDFGYDALWRRTQLTYPNGSTATYGFDPAGQLTQLTHAGVFSAPYTYGYDAAGRISQLTGDGPNWTYAYDKIGRLTSAIQGTTTYTYTFDAVGNILDGGRVHDVNHRLLSDAAKTYAYDQRGNLTLEQDIATGARVVYGWNLKNQLLRIDFYPTAVGGSPTRTLQFTYDAIGRRASKTDGGVTQRYTYDGDDLLGTLDSAGNVVSTQTFSGRIDEVLASGLGAVQRSVYGNHLNSTVGIVESGALTHSYRYNPYGGTAAPSSADSLPFRYAGREKDTDDLYYYRGRYYNTRLQRFISVDPLGLVGGINPYAYVEGDPINSRDPFGLQSLPNPNGVVPGGPWTPHDANKPGQWLGPKSPSGGGRAQCQWVPPEGQGGPPGSDGYWKTNQPGQKGWQRFDQKGNPISPEEAHPGNNNKPKIPFPRIPGVPFLICPACPLLFPPDPYPLEA